MVVTGARRTVTPSGRNALRRAPFLLVQGAVKLTVPAMKRSILVERKVRAHPVVQGDEITPIRSRNLRFSTSGIRGSGVLFMSMR